MFEKSFSSQCPSVAGVAAKREWVGGGRGRGLGGRGKGRGKRAMGAAYSSFAATKKIEEKNAE